MRHLMMGGARVCYNTGIQGGGSPGGDPGAGGAGGGQQGGSQTQGGNNGGGNSDSGANNAGSQNNAGTGFDAASFWNEPAPAAAASSPGNSTESGATGAGTQQSEGQRTGQEFAQRLTSLEFGAVFTPEIAQQIAQGDLGTANAAIQGQLRKAAEHSVVMSAQLMQRYGENLKTEMVNQMRTMLNESFGNRDTEVALETNFPSAKDPAIRPVVQGIYQQALKLAKGDRVAAIASTKEMLKYMGKSAAPDLGLNNPPPSAGDSFGMTDSSRSLVEELLGRS